MDGSEGGEIDGGDKNNICPKNRGNNNFNNNLNNNFNNKINDNNYTKNNKNNKDNIIIHNNNNNNNNKKINILIKCLLLLLLFSIILNPLKDILIDNLTYMSYIFLKFLKYPATVSNNILSIRGFNIEIVGECVGVEFFAIYLSGIVVISKSLRKVLYGLLFILLIYLGNILRIVVISIMVANNYDFNTSHDIAGYLIMPITTVIAFLLYYKLIKY